MDITLVFAVAGIIISVGFLANLIFKRTGFPDILFLILTGIFFGPTLKLFSAVDFLSASPVFTVLTLTLILFQGGLNMEIHAALSQSFRAASLGLIYVALSTLITPILSYLIVGFGLLEGLILGSMVAGTSSVVVIPLVSKMNVPDDVKATLSLESTITDVLNIILVMLFLEIYFGAHVNIQEIISSLITGFAVGIFLGAIVGVSWIKVLDAVKRQEYVYMLTMAALTLCYAGTEFLSGSGPLSALVFGIVLGNFRRMKILGINIDVKSMQMLIDDVRSLQREVTFLIRALFFFILGLIYTPDMLGFVCAAAIVLVNLVIRNLAVRILTRKSLLYKYRNFMTLMCGTGLANATLSLMVYSEMAAHKVPIASLYPLIVTNITVMNNIVTSLTPLLARRFKS